MIDIIAPGGEIRDPSGMARLEAALSEWGYHARFGNHILNNSLKSRLADIKTALYSPDSHIIWTYRGGSGASELLPELYKLAPPEKPKLFLGFSDITALHIFLIQQWGWTVYHGPGARQIADKLIDNESIDQVKLLFDTQQTKPLPLPISGDIIGGNLSIISHSLGTPFQINTDHKHLLLEDVNEPAYKIRRMLTQLKQAGLFKSIKSLLIGEFSHKNPGQQILIQELLQNLQNTQLDNTIPVYFAPYIGHGKTNYIVKM